MKKRQMISNFFLILTLLCPCILSARSSSYPYLSGDTFRQACDYIYDETGNSVVPKDVQYGETIFLKTDYLDKFFTHVHPEIANPYVLVTHNSDYHVPQKFGYLLDDPKILAWYGQNVDYIHPKLHPIPIGIANRYWRHGNIDIVAEVQKLTQGMPRNITLYMNFSPSTYTPVRPYVYELFKDKPFCTVSPQKDFRSYLFDVGQTKFVLSPRGNGLDCHRTWETLYLGAIPIVISSTIDSLYDELPVIIIKDWKEVTLEFLEIKWEEMSHMEYQIDRLYADYWLNKISSYKSK